MSFISNLLSAQQTEDVDEMQAFRFTPDSDSDMDSFVKVEDAEFDSNSSEFGVIAVARSVVDNSDVDETQSEYSDIATAVELYEDDYEIDEEAANRAVAFVLESEIMSDYEDDDEFNDDEEEIIDSAAVEVSGKEVPTVALNIETSTVEHHETEVSIAPKIMNMAEVSAWARDVVDNVELELNEDTKRVHKNKPIQMLATTQNEQASCSTKHIRRILITFALAFLVSFCVMFFRSYAGSMSLQIQNLRVQLDNSCVEMLEMKSQLATARTELDVCSAKVDEMNELRTVNWFLPGKLSGTHIKDDVVKTADNEDTAATTEQNSKSVFRSMFLRLKENAAGAMKKLKSSMLMKKCTTIKMNTLSKFGLVKPSYRICI